MCAVFFCRDDLGKRVYEKERTICGVDNNIFNRILMGVS